MSLPDPDRMRISDDERAAVGAQLREALDAGRLQLHEFDERTRGLYEAQTYGEVNRLLEDLPSAELVIPQQRTPEAAPRRRPTAKAGDCEKADNTMGHIALGMGVFSFVSFVPFTILAIVFGLMGLDKYRKGEADNRSFALAGLILGVVSIPVWIVFFLLGATLWW
jgi:hypothetical protein